MALQGSRDDSKNSEFEGNLVHADEVERAWVMMIIAFRSRMLAIPVKLAPLVAANRFIPECAQLLKTGIYEALTELHADIIRKIEANR